jgi:hypothetical protein
MQQCAEALDAYVGEGVNNGVQISEAIRSAQVKQCGIPGTLPNPLDGSGVGDYVFRLVELATDFEQSVQCAKFDTNLRVCAALSGCSVRSVQGWQ